MGTRSAEIGRGLARVESGVGTLIAFSTQPEGLALDGDGRNSPFAQSLIARIKSQAARHHLSEILIDVRDDVIKTTGGKQVPWDHSSLTTRFFLVPPSGNGEPPGGEKEIKTAPSASGKTERLIVKFRPDGSAQYKLSDIAAFEHSLPTKDECEKLWGETTARTFARLVAPMSRFWVRLGPGDLGYCQPGRQKWVVEHFNRGVLEGLVILLRP